MKIHRIARNTVLTILAAFCLLAACSGSGGVWFPDLQKTQASWSMGVLVKF
jgi:hypothetical protein